MKGSLTSLKLSATGRTWQQRPQRGSGFTHAGMPAMLVAILSARGVVSGAVAESYLRAELGREHDPRQLPNVVAAFERTAHAIEAGELIAVFGDYDVDGVTSAVILTEGLRSLGGSARAYLPDRYAGGYGLSEAAVLEMHGQGVTLIVTADCGISAVDEVARANELGIDVIVIDHHAVPERLPEAAALVNPKLDGCLYPCLTLAACGVGFKFLLGLAEQLGSGYDPEQHLDLVALGTVCDMVPLEGENRTLVRRGLRTLARTHRPGLHALAETGRFDLSHADAETCGFRIGPRLNAAGRLQHANLAFELLTTHDEHRARDLALELNRLNGRRQQMTAAAMELARELVERDQRDAPLLLVGHERISRGIVGLVAGRLAEEYGRPALVYEAGATEAIGSARSIPGFDIFASMQASRALFRRAGGHEQAAGFTVATANIPALREQLQSWAAASLGTTPRPRLLEHDGEVELSSVGSYELRWLQTLEPYGQGNPEPIFVGRGLTVVESRPVGADRSHLRLRLGSGGAAWPGIAFGLAHVAPATGTRIDAAFALRAGDRGRLDLHIKDFALA